MLSMDEIVNFKIKNFGPINNANIDIRKINIIGGHNSTGKSTASKLLYCFLKSNSNTRQDLAFETIKHLIRITLNHLNNDFRYSRDTRNMDFIELFELYEKYKEDYYQSNEIGDNKMLDDEIQDLDNAILEIQENDNSLYLSIIRNLLKNEFKTKYFDGCFSIKNYSNEKFFEFIVNLFDYDLDSDSAFKSKGSIDVYDTFYIDSFSIFDLTQHPSSLKMGRNGYYDHIDSLRLMLRDTSDESTELFDDKRNKKIISVERKIKKIIGGKIEYRGKFTFISNNYEPCNMENTASGIKQIGVIQLLLSNRQLKENSFLIIDEPEVNLHPEWQFKFAEILILLVKDLNISIYINTHSPMFIEAIEVLTKYYGLDDDTTFYLTEKDNKYGNSFVKIEYDNLYELYDNLAKPFDAIEVYRLKHEYKKEN